MGGGDMRHAFTFIWWVFVFALSFAIVLWRLRWLILLGLVFLLISMMGCGAQARRDQASYCENIYLDPRCKELRARQEKERQREMVKVCELRTGSRIPRNAEKCEEVSREVLRRQMETRGGQ